jgi:hypothetical protein
MFSLCSNVHASETLAGRRNFKLKPPLLNRLPRPLKRFARSVFCILMRVSFPEELFVETTPYPPRQRVRLILADGTISATVNQPHHLIIRQAWITNAHRQSSIITNAGCLSTNEERINE